MAVIRAFLFQIFSRFKKIPFLCIVIVMVVLLTRSLKEDYEIFKHEPSFAWKSNMLNAVTY